MGRETTTRPAGHSESEERRNGASGPGTSMCQNDFTPLPVFCFKPAFLVLTGYSTSEPCLPVCTRVQMRSLSSLPRTLLRLISYSVAGYSLVMVNSVTVLGTTELSSRPTEEEQSPSLKVQQLSHQWVHGSVYIGTMGREAQMDVGSACNRDRKADK